MNMFIHELKQNAKALLFWCLGMLFLVGASVAKTSGAAQDAGAGLEGMVALLPKAMQNLFGYGVVDFSQPIGIFAIIALYIALIAAYHACGLGVAAFAKEERDRTFEFLYVRGRARPRILCAKLMSDLLQILVLNALTYAFSVLIVQAVDHQNIARAFLPMMLGILVLELLFYALGLLTSFLTHRMRTASSVSSGLIMALFLIYMMASLIAPDAWFAYLSPFKYFDGKAILVDGLSGGAALACIALSAVMVCISFRLHSARDLHT